MRIFVFTWCLLASLGLGFAFGTPKPARDPRQEQCLDAPRANTKAPQQATFAQITQEQRKPSAARWSCSKRAVGELLPGEAAQTKRIINHVAKRTRMSPSFKKLLTLVALRESSYQQGLVHQLEPDMRASRRAWRKTRHLYDGNPVAGRRDLWLTYGLFGMNSNYYTQDWDHTADPRVLCDPIVDVLVYRRAAKRALRKLNGTIRCRDANGEAFDYQTEPTWAAIHRAVSGGKVCPPPAETEGVRRRRSDFNARASRKGLDPYERVTGKMLGAEPDESVDGEPWETQEAMVEGLWAEIDP